MPSHRTRLILKTIAFTLLAAGAIAAAGAAAVFYGGLYYVGATKHHLPIIYGVLEKGMQYSVRRNARDIDVPRLGAPEQVRRGAAVYRDHCAQCHGGPGFAQSSIGMSMQPVPGPLIDATLNWKDREIYWITRHGIKMSGMPAWEFHLSDADIWATVAFIRQLPDMSAQDYRAITANEAQP
ncbi:cytochrome c [Massilia sp. YIM B02763]|uniref:c-type cytochrome n=1 Tax=Massilia sp. YIM B02763 TaxID=3050130 RepID=UPI0025B6FB24|nr:cytochrome c [Massilia sp. YIM B02763]MDN4056410.1 cytochrome c [Massilia sp. YIM B02763]